MKRAAILLLLVVVSSGCVGLRGDDFMTGVDALEEGQKAVEDVDQTLDCASASITISSAEWDGERVATVVENDGNVPLSGFDVRVEGLAGTVTVVKETEIPAGGTATLSVTTVDEPESVSISSRECRFTSDSSAVVTE